MQKIEQINALEEYLSSVFTLSHSLSTVRSYRTSITNKTKTGFRDFILQRYNIDEFELVSKVNHKELDIYKVLREFVVFLDQLEYKPKSIKSMLAATNGYLRHLGLKIYSEDFKQNVRMPKVVYQQEEPLTKEIIQRILRNLPPKLQTIVLVLCASGMRIGELVQLKLSDIDFSSKPTKIKLRAETTKTRTSRETFLTSETTNALKDYLRRYFGWEENLENYHLRDVAIFARTSIFRNKKTKYTSYLAFTSLLSNTFTYHIRKISGLQFKNENGRNAIHFHAFRKFFRTTVGNAVGRDFAEALIGHRFYMDTYYQLSDEKKREMYLQAEPYLTISDFKTVENNLKEISSRYSQLEKKVNNLIHHLSTNNIEIPEFFVKQKDSLKF